MGHVMASEPSWAGKPLCSNRRGLHRKHCVPRGLYRVEQCIFKIHVHPEPQNLTIFGYSLCRCDEVKIKSYWIRVGPTPVTDILIRGKFGHRHREENAM